MSSSSSNGSDDNKKDIGSYIQNVYVAFDDQVKTAILVVQVADGREISYQKPLSPYRRDDPGLRAREIGAAINAICESEKLECDNAEFDKLVKKAVKELNLKELRKESGKNKNSDRSSSNKKNGAGGEDEDDQSAEERKAESNRDRRKKQREYEEQYEEERKKREGQSYIKTLSTLTEIDDPGNSNREVICTAVIASNTISYSIPKSLIAMCVHQDAKSHHGEKLWNACPSTVKNPKTDEVAQKRQEITIRLSAEQMIHYVDNKNRKLLNYIFAREHFAVGCRIVVREDPTTLYRVRLRPHVKSIILGASDQDDIAAVGAEAKYFDVYMVSETSVDHSANFLKEAIKDLKEAASSLSEQDYKKLADEMRVNAAKNAADNNSTNNNSSSSLVTIIQPGGIYKFWGKVIAEPKTQRISMVVSHVVRDQSLGYDLERVKQLKAYLDGFVEGGGNNVQQKIDFIVRNFQRVSGIRRREDAIISVFLGFFSPLYVEVDHKGERGWMFVLLLGDTTVGKSEICKQAMRLLGAGKYCIGENATVAGLVAATTKGPGDKWLIDWGTLPMEDRRLVAIDGIQKMQPDHFAKLAEVQREGMARSEKAARGETYARTRQILIANAVNSIKDRSTKRIGDFTYPCQALQSLFELQSIARLDLCIFASADDVPPDEINSRREGEDARIEELIYNLKDLRAFAWESGCKIEYQGGDEFTDEVYRYSNLLINEFACNSIPLVTVGDTRFKLVRMAVALAFLTCSFSGSYDKVIVTKEHLDFVYNFLKINYTKAGLQKVSEQERQASGDMIAPEQWDGFLIAVAAGTPKYKDRFTEDKIREILAWISVQQEQKFTIAQLKAKFSEIPVTNGIDPLVAILQNEGVIRRGGRNVGFILTGKGVKMAKAYPPPHDKSSGGDNPGPSAAEPTPTAPKNIEHFDRIFSEKEAETVDHVVDYEELRKALISSGLFDASSATWAIQYKLDIKEVEQPLFHKYKRTPQESKKSNVESAEKGGEN